MWLYATRRAHIIFCLYRSTLRTVMHYTVNKIDYYQLFTYFHFLPSDLKTTNQVKRFVCNFTPTSTAASKIHIWQM